MCSELKFLLSLGWYIAWGWFMEFSKNFRFLTIISKNLMLIEFSGFFRHKVGFSKNPKLVDFNGFLRLWFGVKAIYYKAVLFAMRGSK